MRLRLNRGINHANSSCEGDGKWARQEVPECPSGDGWKDNGDKKSLSEPNKQKEEDEVVMAPRVTYTPAAPSPPPTIVQEMEEMFLRLGFSQAVVLKLVDDQGIDSPWTLASLYDEDIADICDVIHRPGGLESGKTLERANQISVLAMKNLKLQVFMFKTMECCYKDYLCCATNINRSSKRRNQTTSRRPKLIRITGQRLWRT